MADSLVSGALNMITSVAQQQLKLFACATHELKRLSDTFRPIEALLSDAESRQAVEERVHDWLSRLKHVAYDIDDVLAEGKILGLGEEGDDEGDFMNKVIQYLLSPCNFFDHVVSRYKVACRVKEIRERLDDIAADRNNYNFSSSAVKDGASSHRLTTPLIKKSEVMIGRENDREIMISSLVSGSSYQGAQVHVVAIVGIGGLGKTTLARQLYQDRRVQNHFNGALYWVCVSETFDVTRLIKEILEQVKGEGTSLTGLGSLQIELLKSLKGKRFLLVLDDVWNDDAEQWETLGASLNGEVHGSIILVTTRRDEVARTMNATYIHELEGLSEEDSLSLFRSTAFEGKEVMGYSVLANVERKIVNNCKGVPLSIKAIGSVMRSTNRTVEDWENVVSSKAWCEPQVMGKVLPPLLLSYTHLPSHLKQCFAYCSMFPKDWEFNKDMLVRLWVAEGFVRSEGNRETEDVGAEHFDQLVAWSMFQEVEDGSQGTVCKMHDLMHDLAEFVAKDDIYRFISIEDGKSEECGSRDVRHAFLSFTGTDDTSNKMPITLRGAKKLRTLYLSGVQDESHKAMVVDLFRQSRFLRAVVFEYSGINRLPNAIGEMKHLRFLDLSGSHVVELPESVTHLRNLHTLNLNDCRELKKLPRGIGRMFSLRHLEIEGTDGLQYLPKGLGRISGLRSLCKFLVGGGGEGVEGCRIDELQRLNSLHGSLEILGLGRVSSREEAEKAQLGNKPYLRRLVLWTLTERRYRDDAVTERMDNVLEGLRPHVNLEQLGLCEYRGSRLPSWMAVMRSLRTLVIWNCRSLGSLPDSLGQLESLQHLRILRCWELDSLPHSCGRLKALNHLDIITCPALRSLPDSLGHLESLLHLQIDQCKKLESLPQSFGQLKALNHLEISHCDALKSLPDSLGQLESLQDLKINWCKKLESLPHSFGQLKALNHLEIEGCPALRSLPDSLGQLESLQHLKISLCGKLELLPHSFGQLKALNQLGIWNCPALRSLPDSLGQLESLQDLRIMLCEKLESLPHSFGQLKALSHLEIRNCDALRSLPDSLGREIADCEKLESLSDSFGQLKALNHLEIEVCPALRSLPDSLGQLESLQHLKISMCGKLESLPHSFGQLKALNQLEIGDCPALRSLPDSLGQLESLQQLEITGCEKLESLPRSFGQLKALNRLKIGGCPALRSLPDLLGQLESLWYLRITECEKLESLPHSFGHLTLLQQLTISGCPLLSERCKWDGGDDWPKISHIPNIIIDYRWIR